MKVLVINCGSSSLKYELFDTDTEQSLAKGLCDRVGVGGGRDAVIEHETPGKEPLKQATPMPDHRVAIDHALAALISPVHGVISSLDEIAAVGHRVVHGGEKFAQSVVIDDEVEQAVEDFCQLAPLHNPPNLLGIRACREALPTVPQVAVFDTAFHQTMPPHAYIYALPYELYEQHRIRRYGFHGTSHRYVSLRASEYLEQAGVPLAEQKVVTCHLGNGCSMAAVRAGKSIDTTMGMTPLEGLVMGTRCGDLDPALPLHLMEVLQMSAQEIDNLLNKRSGLLGVSGIGSDMRDNQSAALGGNDRAKLAVDIFCQRVRKYIGAYAAGLGGLNCIVFTAGIGENDPALRAQVIEGLEFMGARVDPARNEQLQCLDGIAPIQTEDSTVHVLVIQTDEELMIARDTAELLSGA
ncbi:MAG TPA: acetate kinase [Armatimonadota bacterium]|nr:acetate kinase [Armatimonadota bacterium]